MKICTKCKIEKNLSLFHKHKRLKDGHYSLCKECRKIELHVYYLKNKDTIKARNKKWKLENLEKYREIENKYNKSDRGREARKTYDKKYRENNKEKIKQIKSLIHKNRMKTDLNYKLAHLLRSRLKQAIKNNQKSGSAVRDLGCTIPELKIHLESKFQSGMTWDNWGTHGWHIDHIKPLISFNLSNREDLLKAVYYTNLQPLWAIDNYKKRDKVG